MNPDNPLEGTLRIDWYVRTTTRETNKQPAEAIKRTWEEAGTTRAALPEPEPQPQTIADAI